MKEIRKWHKARGFNDIGYHFVIKRNGEIEIGRTLNDIGAHCKGYNIDSVGTCLIGKNGNFTGNQYASLKRIDKMLIALFPLIKTYPHNHFNKHKTCPTFDVAKVLGDDSMKMT